MKRKNKPFRTGLIIALLLCISSAAFSQKETVNAAAPAQVRIDGRITEWPGPFQVNKPTKLSYSIANDQRNVYLVIQSSDSLFNSRILQTGISFMINQAGKKKEGPVVTFPVIDRAGMMASARGAVGGQRPDLLTIHKNMIASVKEIKVSGFKEIADPSISIYNEYGIKGTGSFDEKDNFIYELAIPLSLLGLSADNAREVAYNIKINGSLTGQDQGFRGPGGGFNGPGGFGGGPGGFPGGDRGAGGGEGGRGGNANANNFYEATDFWINYKLAKTN